MSFLTNTGLYLLEDEVINDISKDEFIHLPDIAQRYIDKGENVGVYPVTENAWLDMGETKEMQKMINKLNLDV